MDAKAAARERFDAMRDELIGLSHRIHAEPEVGFQEEKASGWVAETLSGAGFEVERGICELPTALSARAGSGPLHVTICAEYDSLPGIGHACGHNVIAAAGVGAAIAAARVADDVGLTVELLGTPAEEGGGGKILMLDRGAFSGAHAAMMVHPSPLDVLNPNIIAVSHFDVHYTGKEAHAAAYPQQGVNAADALTIAQVAIGLLRQHIRPSDRMHGIVTKGGEAPNIVPAHTSGTFLVRSRTIEELGLLRPKVERCFEAGALATGAELEIVDKGKPYAHMEQDPDMSAAYKENAEALGRVFADIPGLRDRAPASTDMGNVSLALPSIHPMIGINSFPAVNHQPEFAEHCVTEPADQAVADGALSMAWTAIDMATDAALRDRLLARASN